MSNQYECPSCGASIRIPNEDHLRARVAELEAEREEKREEWSGRLHAALKERDAARAVLRQFEFAGSDGCGYSRCRVCGGYSTRYHPDSGLDMGHKPDCALAKALGDEE
jgi:hypothetical protein